MDTKLKSFWSTNSHLIILSSFKFLLLLIFAHNYGIFRDEFYYIECSKHLAFGFVDQQPLSAIILAVSRSIFGDSILGIRVLAYLAGAVFVFYGGLIAREFGGNKFSEIVTGLTIIFSGVLLGTSSYFSMNSFDILLSVLFFYQLVKFLKDGNKNRLYIIGLIFGLGLENKLSFLFLGSGLFAGLLLTKHRSLFKEKEFWYAVAIIFLLSLPNIIWQVVNGFPTLEFMHNASLYKNQQQSFIDYTLNVFLEMNPGFVLFFLAGIYFFFFDSMGKKFRILGWLFITVYLIFVFNNGKPYYIGVLLPYIFAGGSVLIINLLNRFPKIWMQPLVIILMIPSFILVTPFAIPILDVQDLIRFQDFTGIKPSSGERSELGVLPQFYADRFGWEEMVKEVADIYNSLPAEEKSNTLIFGQNYGEAGAVNYFAEKYNLPKAISSHNNYWIWGNNSNVNADVYIVIGSNREDNLEFFEEVIQAGSHFNKYGMPYENVDIFICRKPRRPMSEFWEQLKSYI